MGACAVVRPTRAAGVIFMLALSSLCLDVAATKGETMLRTTMEATSEFRLRTRDRASCPAIDHARSFASWRTEQLIAPEPLAVVGVLDLQPMGLGLTDDIRRVLGFRDDAFQVIVASKLKKIFTAILKRCDWSCRLGSVLPMRCSTARSSALMKL